MAKERCLKKSFKDSLEDIKERMKEKRNQKWAKLGKTNQVLFVKAKIADNSSTQLKSFQANNRALALALEEEKSKVREAQDTILHLKKEYQSLKFQMFVLQRKLDLQQGKEHSETRLIALKKIISKVIQDLCNATNLLGPAKDQYTTVFNQTLCDSECDSSSLRNQESMAHPRHLLAVDVSKQTNTFRTEIKNNVDNNSDFVSKSWQDAENSSSVLTPQIDTGWQSSFHEDLVENDSRNEEDEQPGFSFPTTISTRRRYPRLKIQNELCVSDGNNPEAVEQIKEYCQQDELGNVIGLEKNKKQYEETYVSQEMKYDISIGQSLQLGKILTESNTSGAVPKQNDFNTVGVSQMQKERSQKRKLETVKNLSRTRSKKERSHNKLHNSKEKTDVTVCSSDAYDFAFEESVHITPFRQNKNEEINASVKSCTEETETLSSESFVSEDDSDDSLYMPYTKKSKLRKSFGCRPDDASPLHTRPRLKKAVYETHERNTDEKNGIIKKSENSTDQETIEPDKTSGALEKDRPCLGDITNFASPTSTQTEVSHPLISAEVKYTSQKKRRCIASVSYKEPSISGKLRRGDPFTDIGFLNSPIFKDKSCNKRKSQKESAVQIQ